MRLLALLLCLLLAACASGPPKRIYPPQARVQELQQQADGSISLQLRVQNFSTIAMRFSRLQLQLVLGDAEAVSIDVDPALAIGPGSADLHAQRLQLPASAAAHDALLLRPGKGSPVKMDSST